MPLEEPERRSKKLKIAAVIVVFILLLGGIIAAVVFFNSNKTPVPKAVTNSVSFPVYYPDQKKLPSGYLFDPDSIKLPIKDGVTYAVSSSQKKKIVFSLQKSPASEDLSGFNASYIPLHNDYQMSLGTAEIGSYHNQTLVSLPINGGPWIIITAPIDIDQNQLKQILSSLKK